jgi:hypothetical protein
MIQEGTIVNVRYDNVNKDEVTYRTIVPTSVPATVVRAIDVSELSQSELQTLTDQLAEYNAYKKQYFSMMLSFEDFVEQSTNKRPTVKWRAFTPSQLHVLDK